MPSTLPSRNHQHLAFPENGPDDFVRQGLAFIRHALAHWRPAAAPKPLGDALLLTSELLTNALEHARRPLALDLHLDPSADRLRIEVTDPVTTEPRLCWGRPDEPYGYGLQIVDHLASAWGCSTTPDGKTIWAVLHLPDAPS